MPFLSIKTLILITFITLLTACGGGGSKSPTPQLTEKTPLGTQNTLTPEYSFSSTLAGSIGYQGACTSNTKQAIAGENTIKLSKLEWWGEYDNCEITVTSDKGKVSLPLKLSQFEITPTLTELQPLDTVHTLTPTYSFTSDAAGELITKGSCKTDTTQVTAGYNGIKLSGLDWFNTYENCEISVRFAGKTSLALKITAFTLIPKPTEVTALEEASTLTPDYTFETDFAGTIEYEGSCSSETEYAAVGENTIELELSKWWITYDDCKLWITTAEGKKTDKLSITPFRTIYPARTPLNDTGMDFCANMPRQADGSFIPTGSSNNIQGFSAKLNCADFGVTQTEDGWDGEFVIPAGQDATHGRDALAAQGKLEKIGDGHAGFDFTKLDKDGNELLYSAEQYACVRDNHTNLIWEVKQDTLVKDDLHSSQATFCAAVFNSSDPITEQTECEEVGQSNTNIKTDEFINIVNENGYCGLNDWRLPSYTETLSIANIPTRTNRYINPENDILVKMKVSTIHTSDFIIHNDERYSTYMTQYLPFPPRIETQFLKIHPHAAVLVHSGANYTKPHNVDEKYEELNNATALDKNTGLIWTRCPEAMDNDETPGNICNKTYYWDEALGAANFANEQQFLGYNDWRLPSATELASLLDFGHAPFINQDVFSISNIEQKTFWTSTPSLGVMMPEGLYSLHFNYYDELKYPSKSNNRNYMLLVRGGY